MKLPRISIALAVYNGEKYLFELLTSLDQQELQPFEIVVLDDCSSDKSADIIKGFSFSTSQIHYFRNEANIGAQKTFKKLIGLCTGDYIAFCDQDDIWMPHKLKIFYSTISKDDQFAETVFSDLTLINETGNIIQHSFWNYYGIQPEKTFFFDILFDNVITGCAVLINKKMIDLLRIMPDEIMMHDHWMALVAYSFGTRKIIDEPTVYYRLHSDSVTNKEKQSFLQMQLNKFHTRDYFLKKNIQQAFLFKQAYKDRLAAEDIVIINFFLALSKNSYFKNHVISFLRKSIFRKILYPKFYSLQDK